MMKDPAVARVVLNVLGGKDATEAALAPRWPDIYMALFQAFRRTDLPPELAPFYPRVRMSR